MLKNALIILAEGFEEIEATTVIDVLRRASISVTVCGLKDILVTGSRNIKIQADVKLGAYSGDFDALILPGGSKGAENLSKSQRLESLIKKADKESKIIAAICAAPAVVLAPLGILDGKTATCFPGMEEDFSEKTKFSQEKVVEDVNLITSRGPGTAIEFALKVVEKLAGPEVVKGLRKSLLA